MGAADPKAARAEFEDSVVPVLEMYCTNCHGPEKSKADLRIDHLDPDLVNGESAEHWEEVLNQLNVGEMPPEDEKQPTPKEREILLDWISGQLRHAAEVKRSTGGRSVLRRLTRYEYNNTLRDLLGIEMDYAKDLPSESAAKEGFVNNGAVLGTSSLHMEYYQRIAAGAIRRALATSEKPDVFVFEESGKGLAVVGKPNAKERKKKKGAKEPVGAPEPKDERGFVLRLPTRSVSKTKNGVIPGGYFQYNSTEIPSEGPIRITARAVAPDGLGADPTLQFQFGYDGGNSASPFGVAGELEVAPGGSRELVLDVRAEEYPLLPHTGKSQFLRIQNVTNAGTAGGVEGGGGDVVLESVRIEAPYYETWPPESRSRILIESENSEDEEKYAREVLEHFMGRAYRRPPSGEEVDRMHGLFGTLRPRSSSFEEALVGALSGVLSSPGFLLIAEPAVEGQEAGGARPLNGYEIASRLSYFLWSTMPDDRLFELAESGKLSDKKVLAAEVNRMLDDPKSAALFEHFTSQWLGLDGIYSVAINPEFFPKFDESLKPAMVAETVAFFAGLVKGDRSALELVDSEFAMLNGALAEHYGIDGVAGNAFRPVPLKPGSKRGGILTQASVLTSNSSGDGTHPIKRGVWLMERILGDPPPPPPPAVPTLAENDKVGERMSLKAKLEAHRQEEACMACHKRIDPYGVAFENYDGVGIWRGTTIGVEPVLKAPEKKEDVVEPAAPATKEERAGLAFDPEPSVKEPVFPLPEGGTERAVELTKALNESLATLQRPYNHLRKMGSGGAGDKLRRFLGYIEIREPAVETAIDALLKETGEDRGKWIAAFRRDYAETLESNLRIRRGAEAFAPNGEAKVVQKKRRKKPAKVEDVRRGAVDPKTELADGTEIGDLDALKSYLLKDKKDEVAETLVRRMLSYALGRYLDFTDTKTVESIHAEFAEGGYRMRRLIEAVVTSEPFLTK